MAIWGASHQGFTLAATAKLTKKIEYIIDSAPFKQGKYAPASHIPIISPADALLHSVDAIIIMAPGYTDEIAAIIKRDFGQGTEIAVMKAKIYRCMRILNSENNCDDRCNQFSR